MNTPYEPESTGDVEYVPDEDELDLGMLANDLNEVLCGDEYGFDLSDNTVRDALPGFIALLRERAVQPVCDNGCPGGPRGQHKMSCSQTKATRQEAAES